jgi:DNA-binding transcriptional regulator LsrR (DeoR family)
MDGERRELLAKVGTMYYIEEKTQLEISEELGYSRSCISRFLTEARKAGIVEIHINDPHARVYDLEEKVIERFALKEVRVFESEGMPYSSSLRKLGSIAAIFLREKIINCQVLGIAWGTSLYEMVTAFRFIDCPKVKVVQLVGSALSGGDADDGPGLVRSLANKLNGPYYTLPAPWILSDKSLRDGLMADRRMREVLDLTEKVDLVFEGIGLMDPDLSGYVRVGHLTLDEVRKLNSIGVVGDICGIHFDINGNIIDVPQIGYAVGIKPEILQNVPVSVGIGAGHRKAPAILGGIRSRLINSLVIDSETARIILDMDK